MCLLPRPGKYRNKAFLHPVVTGEASQQSGGLRWLWHPRGLLAGLSVSVFLFQLSVRKQKRRRLNLMCGRDTISKAKTSDYLKYGELPEASLSGFWEMGRQIHRRRAWLQ